MKLVGIDVGKNSHHFCVMDKETGEFNVTPSSFPNNKEGFDFLINSLKPYSKKSILLGMEDTGHYHVALLKFLLSNGYTVALINPKTTDLTRKMEGGITKNDKLDTITICDVLDTPERKKQYRITKVDRFDLYEQRQLTRHHHNLKEELNVYCNRLQKSIDLVFPEFNTLFSSKYGIVYMNLLKTFGSAEAIASTDIRTIRKFFEIKGKGNRISLTPEKLKECAKNSIGISSEVETIQIKHLISQITLIKEQIAEIDKKIEEFSITNNSPILSIPGISHFSGTSILAELGDIGNYSKPSLVITHEMIFKISRFKIIYFFMHFNSVLVFTIVMKRYVTYPDWVEKFRSPGHTIKKTKQGYGLYSCTSKYVPGGKPKSIQTYLGKITPDGFIPKSVVSKHPVYVEFGLSHFIISSFKRDLIRSSFRATDDTVYLGVVQYIFGSCQDIFLSSCFLTYKNKESLCKYRDSISATRIKT